MQTNYSWLEALPGDFLQKTVRIIISEVDVYRHGYGEKTYLVKKYSVGWIQTSISIPRTFAGFTTTPQGHRAHNPRANISNHLDFIAFTGNANHVLYF